MDDAVRFERLTRSFGATRALDGFSASVPRGSVTALLGRNGSGKTTAIRCAAGVLRPDEGRALVLGHDAQSVPEAVRARIGYVGAAVALDPRATLEELAALGTALYPAWDAAFARDLAARLALEPHAPIGALSTGQARKTALWFNLAFRPALLLLDEPASGLDAVVRREFLEVVLDAFRSEGTSVLLATHLLADVERMADRVILIDGGRARFDRELDRLKDEVKALRVRADGAPSFALPAGARLLCRRRFGDDELLTVEGFDPSLPQRVFAATGANVDVVDLPLEEIVIAYGVSPPEAA